MYNQFSQYDIDLAKKYPEFGTSLATLKQQYAQATTPEQKALINSQANSLRQSYGNYSGGPDGSSYISGGLAPSSYNSPYQENISGLLGSMNAYPGSYNNQYSSQANALLNEIINRPDFSYNKDTDPNWNAYAKQYRREGARASEHVLGQAAAMTGGLPSSAAITAGQQAGDYYASQLADKLPELYQQAYNRYVQEFTMDRSALSDVNTQEQLDYNKWTDQYNMMSNNLGAYQGQDNSEYARMLDQVNHNTNLSAQATEQQRGIQAQVDSILQAGGTPSAALIAQSGYPQEYIDALKSYYAQQAAGSGGGGGGGGYKLSLNQNLTRLLSFTNSDAAKRFLNTLGLSESDEKDLWELYEDRTAKKQSKDYDAVVDKAKSYKKLAAAQAYLADAVKSGYITEAEKNYILQVELGDFSGSSEPQTDDSVASAAASYYASNPNILLDSRTLDTWLADNGYSGQAAQLFKAYLESYGAKYSR